MSSQTASSGARSVRSPVSAYDVGRAGVEVIGPDGVPRRLRLPAEGDAVLVVVRPLLDAFADLDQSAGQLEVSGLARRPIELDDPHVVRGQTALRASSDARVRDDLAEVIGGPGGDLQQVRLAGGSVMDARGRQEMAEVVRFEVEAVLKGSASMPPLRARIWTGVWR